MDSKTASQNSDPGTFALDQISTLVERLRASAEGGDAEGDSTAAQVSENRLVIVRLGLATALFYALRVKHPPSASHSLRVALDCSMWAAAREMDAADRDRFEVAALLHDIGKIGIPDRILKKQSALTVEERLTVDLQAALGCEILRGCCSDEFLLETVRRFHDRYIDRRRSEAGEESSVPLTARMLAIAEAFDAMTSFQPHRKTLSMDEAFAELKRCAGTQFDPELVEEYEALIRAGRDRLRKATENSWLEDLNRDEQQGYWTRIIRDHHPEFATVTAPDPLLLHAQVVKRVSDGVMLLDPEGTVISFNDQLQGLTGIRESEVLGRAYDSEMLGLLDSQGKLLREADCPIQKCLSRNESLEIDARMRGKSEGSVNLQIETIVNAAGVRAGLMVMVRFSDSPRTDTAGPPRASLPAADAGRGMLGYATVAETVRMEQRPYTLFYFGGEHADSASEAMRHQFSELAGGALRRVCRKSDLLFSPAAGECGVVVFDGGAGEIPSWSEKYRTALASVTLPMAAVHAAVAADCDAELQRSLEQARQHVRENTAESTSESERSLPFWKFWTGRVDATDSKLDIAGTLQTPVPRDLAVQKLEGFVADHRAVIKSQDANHVALQLSVSHSDGGRRRADRRITFHVDIHLASGQRERAVRQGETAAQRTATTILEIFVRPERARDRRDRHWQQAALSVIDNVRSYLMATTLE